MNPRITAVTDTLSRVCKGVSPYEGGPFDTNEMMTVADTFSDQVQHDHFIMGIQERIRSGQDVTGWVKDYLSVVFAQGFSAGSRYETLKDLES